MEMILQILRDYGALGLILAVLLYIILKGKLTFQYPRTKDKSEKEQPNTH